MNMMNKLNKLTLISALQITSSSSSYSTENINSNHNFNQLTKSNLLPSKSNNYDITLNLKISIEDDCSSYFNQENIDFLRDSYSKSLMGWSCGEVWKGERGELVEEHGFKVLGCFWNF